MRVDVVVCVKNQAKPMERVLHQIIREVPFRNLIVVYGTSADETKECAEKYTNNVFWDEDKGLGYARNLGVRKATSEIVAMIDADIILTKGWYQTLIGLFEDPKVAAVMGTCVYGFGYKPLEAYWEYRRRTARTNWGCQNTMFRREAVLKVGNFDAKIKGAGEDRNLQLRLLAAGYKWAWVRDASVYHPMTMREYLKHVRWWTQGRASLDEDSRSSSTISSLRFMELQAFSLIEAFLIGAAYYAVVVHPTFLLYWPAIKITMVSEALKARVRHYA